MRSGDWLGIGVALVIMAIALVVLCFFGSYDLEYRRQKAVNDYFHEKMNQEHYNETMKKIRIEKEFLVITNLGGSIILYSGLLFSIVGVYKKADENSVELRNFYKHFTKR